MLLQRNVHHQFWFVLLVAYMGCAQPKPEAKQAFQPTAYIITLNTSVEKPQQLNSLNFYGICWEGTRADNLRFAKGMGYSHVFYTPGMEDDPAASGLGFYIETPLYYVYRNIAGIDRALNLKSSYSGTQKERIEKVFAWKSNDAFPANIATGWFFDKDSFTPLPDFQQQAVIDMFVDEIIKLAKEKHRPNKNFIFSGFAFDVPQLKGDFWDKHQPDGGRQITLEHWQGADKSLLHPGISHEYTTYSEGMAAFYSQLRLKMKQEFPDAKIILEPYKLYNDWIKEINTLPGNTEFMKDVYLMQESAGTEFVDDERIFQSGLIEKNRTGSTTPDIHDFSNNKVHAARAAINGSWFSWYGRFSGSGDMAKMSKIFEVPNWLQLIRAIPNWENVSGVPLNVRTWSNNIYQSPNSFIGSDVVFSRHPWNGKIYAVFLSRQGKISLSNGEQIKTVQQADLYFTPSTIANNELVQKGNDIELK